MSDLSFNTINDCLACLSLEELADVAICFITDPPGGVVIPETQPSDLRPLVIVTSQEKADEVDRYWRSVFGEVNSSEALDRVREWRRGKELTKLTTHAEAYGAWLEDHE